MEVHPDFRSESMAVFSFDSLTLIFDAAQDDVAATVGFPSKNCDRDFSAMVKRGAVPLERPTHTEWGVRVAYVKGPGELKVEIEGPTTQTPLT